MDAGDREALDHFVRIRKATIRLLEQIPDDWLARNADGEDMPLGWLFMHIARTPDWWMAYCMRDGNGWRFPEGRIFDKNTVRDALFTSIPRVLAFFERSGEDRMGKVFELVPEKQEGAGHWSGRDRVLNFTDHEVHHRGKIVLSLRRWGMSDFPDLFS